MNAAESSPRGPADRPASPAEVSDELARRGNESFVTYESNGLTLMLTPDGPRPVSTPGDLYVSRRQAPPDRRPPRPELFLDREAERDKCALASPFVLELYGDYGVGKSTLLSVVSHQFLDAQLGHFSDGVVYCDPVFYESYDDFLFYVWDHFYTSNLPWKYRPTPASMYSLMRDLDALLIVDDCDFSERELKGLQTTVAGCSVILASEEQRLTNFGRSLLITGLPLEAMREIAMAQLRRQFMDGLELSDETIGRLWTECAGSAKKFELAVSRWATARGRGGNDATGEPSSDEQLLLAAVHSLSVTSSPVPDDVLVAVTRDSDAAGIAADLWRRRELDAHSPRYTCPWPAPLMRPDEVLDHRQRAISYLAAEVDFHDRPEIRQFALRLAEAVVGKRVGGVFEVARRLAESYMVTGDLDGWERAAAAALRIGEHGLSFSQLGWASHNLGAVHLCRGDHASARRHLRDALSHYRIDRHAAPDAVEACSALLAIAVQAAGHGPDDGTAAGLGGPLSFGPRSGAADDSWGAAAAEEFDDDTRADDDADTRELATTSS